MSITLSTALLAVYIVGMLHGLTRAAKKWREAKIAADEMADIARPNDLLAVAVFVRVVLWPVSYVIAAAYNYRR